MKNSAKKKCVVCKVYKGKASIMQSEVEDNKGRKSLTYGMDKNFVDFFHNFGHRYNIGDSICKDCYIEFLEKQL